MSAASSSKVNAPASFFLPFDPNSPLLVAKGVLTTGTLGAITGASIGVVQSKNPFALSINMTINLSIAGLTFFSIREYLVSPLLLSLELTPSHTRRLNALRREGLSEVQRGKLPEDIEAPESLSEVRWNRISDSAIAGGLTGGVLSAAFRGKSTFVKAGITSSLIATLLQLSINQSRVLRLKTLAKQSSSGIPISSSISSSNQTPSTASSPSSISNAKTNSNPSDSSLSSSTTVQPGDTQSQITKSFEDPLKPPEEMIAKSNMEKPSFPETMMNSLTKFLPVRKLTNEEYIQTLEKKRADVDKRLKEIDEEEKRMYDWAQSQK
ncbi:uncharacterized protein I303_105075 [Kwoniella dejecticola CBS 10117]|uniref:Uncharacterized protein n=1 Tax=Kwoniella dejecticola CBS 10117 TaxID=1296121 RepID=A0A1A6A3I4_9TREE|nr:uncharacterized protein I303_05479 [Kwoniella dejecticola CBS 10117]OBR84620.1 hypothetical protein I303_05479 [Kwoniella dejecticola CBS 10117]